MNEEERKEQKKAKAKLTVLNIFTGIFKVIGSIIKGLGQAMDHMNGF